MEVSPNQLGLGLPNFMTIRDSMVVNSAFAFMHNEDPQVKDTLQAHGRGIQESNGDTRGIGWKDIFGLGVEVRRYYKGASHED